MNWNDIFAEEEDEWEVAIPTTEEDADLLLEWWGVIGEVSFKAWKEDQGL